MHVSTLTSQLVEAAWCVRLRGGVPLVVLDLDGTLYASAARTWRILQEFARRHTGDHPALATSLASLRVGEVAYLVEDTLAQVGVTDPEFIAAICEFWQARFFTDEYVLHDLPTPGAVAFVQRLFRDGLVPCYLTGRPAPTMLCGTVRALQRDGFPVGTVGTRLVLKEDVQTPDEDYKRRAIVELRRTGEVVGAFDNEPALCNLFRHEFPDAVVVHLDTVYGTGAPALASGIVQLGDFLDMAGALS